MEIRGNLPKLRGDLRVELFEGTDRPEVSLSGEAFSNNFKDLELYFVSKDFFVSSLKILPWTGVIDRKGNGPIGEIVTSQLLFEVGLKLKRGGSV
jgi:hypothetical protein